MNLLDQRQVVKGDSVTSWEPPRRRPQPSLQELLKELLVRRDYHPGDLLPTEVELASSLGVSRGATREALRGLETLGIIEIRQGHGTRLRDLSLEGLAQSLAFWTLLSERDGLQAIRPIAYVRDVLETASLDQVIGRHTEEDLDEMVQCVTEMRVAAERGEHAPDSDRRFHKALFRPLGNWVFTYILDAFWDVYDDISSFELTPGVHGRLVDETPAADVAVNHKEILDALTAGDEAAVRAGMRRHFDNRLREPGPVRQVASSARADDGN